MTEQTDPRGVKTKSTYDAWGRPVSVLVKADGMAIDDDSQFVARRTLDTFDQWGNPTQSTMSYPAPGGTGEVVSYSQSMIYDELGRAISQTDGGNGVPSLGITTRRHHDVRGNVIKTIDPEGYATTVTYDGLNRPLVTTAPEGIKVEYEYTDQLASSLVYYKDAANKITTSEYDGHGRLVKMTYPDNSSETYDYDKAHRRTESKLLSGAVVTNTYDGGGRVTDRTIVPAENSGVGGHTVETFDYDGLDRLKSLTQDTVAVGMTYDGFGRLKTTTSAERTLNITPGVGGLPTATSYPSGLSLDHAWTSLGRPQNIGIQAGALNTSAAYDWLGGMRSGQKIGSAVQGAWTRDSAGRLQGYTSSQGQSGPVQLSESLTRDRRGLTLSQTFADRDDESWTRTFDGAGRLLTAEFDGNGNAPSTRRADSFGFDYDNVQNLLERRESRACSEEVVAMPEDGSGRHRPEKIGDTELTWNAASNLERKGDLKFTYDYLNRLVKVERNTAVEGAPESLQTVAEYLYDGFNRRIERKVGTSTFETVWSGWQAIEEYENDVLVRRAVYGPGIDEIIALQIQSGSELSTYHPLYDASGHLRVLLDDAGKLVERYDYSPYGERFIEADSTDPTAHQIRLEEGKILIELTEPLDADTLSSNKPTVFNSSGIEIPVNLDKPITEGRQAGKRLELTLNPTTPEHLQVGETLAITVPAAALKDHFGNQATGDITTTVTYATTGLEVSHDTAAPELLHACIKDNKLNLTFSETPDLTAAQAAIMLNGTPSTWTLDDDGYTLIHSGTLSGDQTLTFTSSAFDLDGQAIASTDELNFRSTDNHIWEAPFPGEVVSSTVGNVYGFKGLPLDEETGLLYVRNRYYDPEMGRFVSADPLGFVDGPNQYQFAVNSPVDMSDPLGLYCGYFGSEETKCADFFPEAEPGLYHRNRIELIRVSRDTSLSQEQRNSAAIRSNLQIPAFLIEETARFLWNSTIYGFAADIDASEAVHSRFTEFEKQGYGYWEAFPMLEAEGYETNWLIKGGMPGPLKGRAVKSLEHSASDFNLKILNEKVPTIRPEAPPLELTRRGILFDDAPKHIRPHIRVLIEEIRVAFEKDKRFLEKLANEDIWRAVKYNRHDEVKYFEGKYPDLKELIPRAPHTLKGELKGWLSLDVVPRYSTSTEKNPYRLLIRKEKDGSLSWMIADTHKKGDR